MSRKTKRIDSKESEEFQRILRSSGPDVPNLKKIQTLITSRQQWINNSYNSIEQFLFKLINPTVGVCDLQATEHEHFQRREPAFAQKLKLSAHCLSYLNYHSMQKTRSIDFQCRTFLTLCDSLILAFSLHGLPSSTLSAVRNNLTPTLKSFTSIVSFSKERMPVPEFKQLVYTRIDFFTYVLRSMLEHPSVGENRIQLPLHIAFYHALMSVNVADCHRTSCDLLRRISQLLHCLASMCRALHSLVLPASSLILTMLTYQLEWTSVWATDLDFETKWPLTEEIIRHRLATLNCLCQILPSISNFSSDCLPRLIPRLLNQVINDVVRCTALGNREGSEGIRKFMEYLRRILIANCVFVEIIFIKPIYHSLFLVSHTTVSVGCNKPNSEASALTVRKEFARLELCLFNFIKQITVNFPGGPPFRRQLWTGFHDMPEIHPSVLSALARTLTALLRVVSSPSLNNLASSFLAELMLHPDPQLRLLASQCKERLPDQQISSFAPETKANEIVNQDGGSSTSHSSVQTCGHQIQTRDHEKSEAMLQRPILMVQPGLSKQADEVAGTQINSSVSQSELPAAPKVICLTTNSDLDISLASSSDAIQVAKLETLSSFPSSTSPKASDNTGEDTRPIKRPRLDHGGMELSQQPLDDGQNPINSCAASEDNITTLKEYMETFDPTFV